MVDRRLGRGLDFLLSNQGDSTKSEEVCQIDLRSLSPNPFQPRREFPPTELEELAASIRENGLLQPILARRQGKTFQIVAGERRWRAAQMAGLERIPAVIREVSDDAAAVLGLVENIQRSDLSAIEKAHALKRIVEVAKVSQDEVAKRVGLSRPAVTNFLRLLDLPEAVQAYVSRGTLSMGHARALLGIDDAAAQIDLAERAIRDRMSVRQVESAVQARAESKTAPEVAARGTQRGRPIWLSEIETTLSEALDTPVRVRYGRKRARIILECTGRAEFERVYEKLKGL
jgi:ParB family chromosome partitioning protein